MIKKVLDIATELRAALALSEVKRIAADIKRIGKQRRRNQAGKPPGAARFDAIVADHRGT
ncbi:hypothetical protein [Paraburkholderia sp. 40]|uniref:hypothetical protein n=1 Tax=unclassified Paraburkholderia TaxID=2615204 RepID=UPI003D251532